MKMEKQVRCTKCSRVFKVIGNRGNMKEDYDRVTCPYPDCKEPNEVLWPKDMPFKVEML